MSFYRKGSAMFGNLQVPQSLSEEEFERRFKDKGLSDLEVNIIRRRFGLNYNKDLVKCILNFEHEEVGIFRKLRGFPISPISR